MSERIIIAIPAYDEEYAIGNVVKGIYDLGMDVDVFVIDDGSNDETLKIAKLHGAAVLRHRINLGGGATIRTAFSLAMRMGADYLVTLDGDGQHDPSELPLMIDVMRKDGAALLIGSRFQRRDELEMKMYRRLGIRFFSWVVSWMTGQKISDATSCYRIYDMKYVRMVFPNLKESQYYAIELITQINRLGGRVVEVPIQDIKRMDGNSKKGIIRYCYHLIRVVVKTVLL